MGSLFPISGSVKIPKFVEPSWHCQVDSLASSFYSSSLTLIGKSWKTHPEIFLKFSINTEVQIILNDHIPELDRSLYDK